MRKLLLAEDDFDLGHTLSDFLASEGFAVSWATDGEKAFDLAKQDNFDIYILDVMMPKLDGFELAKKLVKIHPETPFLFLTARKASDDKLKGLKLGADDYIAKPFDVDELVLRLHNIIKRTEQTTKLKIEEQNDEEIKMGKYLFKVKQLELIGPESRKQLTEKEALLLLFLHQFKGQLIPREDILSKVWQNNDFFSGRSMDVFISRLRKYLKDDPKIQIKSVRGAGLEFSISH